MTLASQLGKKAAAMEKEAIPGGKLLGSLFKKIMPAMSGGAKRFGKTYQGPLPKFTPPNLAGSAPNINLGGFVPGARSAAKPGGGLISSFLQPKSLGGLAGRGALGWAGLGAANEGLSAMLGKSPFSPGGDPAWSPHLQGVREMADPSFLGQLTGFLNRPIQSMFHRGSMPRSAQDLITGGTPIPKYDANGQMLNEWGFAPQFSQSVTDMYKRRQQLDDQLGLFGMPHGKPGMKYGPELPPFMQGDPMQQIARGGGQASPQQSPGNRHLWAGMKNQLNVQDDLN